MSNPTELPDLAYDKDMDRHYIPLPGGWEIQTKGKGSTFRIAHAGSGRRWMVLDDQLHDPLVALANAVREALARRAQPEGEALEGRMVSVDVSTGEDDALNRIYAELTGETESDGVTLIAIESSRNFGKPEGEAPQAEPVAYITSDKRMLVFADRVAGNDHGMTPLYAAATLSPLCGAQQAAAPGYKVLPVAPTDAMCIAAREKIGVGRNQADHIYRAMVAAAPGNSPEIPDGSTSAPGTPEAPAAAEKLYASWQHSQADRCNIPPWRLLAESVRIEWERRAAAQIDGGQEGSAT